ncbi:MAG TPA: hypothetical protein V6D14_29480 [Coleofasciculaceae cyanobacterium]
MIEDSLRLAKAIASFSPFHCTKRTDAQVMILTFRLSWLVGDPRVIEYR